MKCPFCGEKNIEGTDNCENCGEDLTAFNGVRPHDSLEKGLVHDPILSAASCRTWTTGPQTTIWEVAQKMDHHNQCCLILEQGKLVGIVTERDILKKALFKDFDLKSTPISKIMTPNPEFLKAEDKLVYALNRMAIRGYRHVPIYKADGSYQVISARDILAYVVRHYPRVI